MLLSPSLSIIKAQTQVIKPSARARGISTGLRLSRRSRASIVMQSSQQPDEGAVDSGESAESLFTKELRRRGISPGSAASSEEAREGGQFTQTRSPPSSSSYENIPQLRQSRALNSEGLEGLIPRAVELAKLGGTFFLAFGPVILTASLAFAALYLVGGDLFIHGGKDNLYGVPPPYLDPDELLRMETVDPMVPLR